MSPVPAAQCNHDRRLILNILDAGRNSGVGLEAGSKAELAMAMSLLADRPGSLLICNGCKDAAYMELVRPSVIYTDAPVARRASGLHAMQQTP